MSNDKTTGMPITPEVMAAGLSNLYRQHPEFRAEFDADPKDALEKFSGKSLPEDVTLVVHRRKPKELHIVLPDADALKAEHEQLSDSEMKNLSGGYMMPPPPTPMTGGTPEEMEAWFDRFIRNGLARMP